jgi:hypothetical protein
MKSPKTLKDVQSLNGRLVALNMFLSKVVEKSFPFANALKECLRKGKLTWNDEAEKAFQNIKEHLCSLPTLASPIPKEIITVYLATSATTISFVLMVDQEKV